MSGILGSGLSDIGWFRPDGKEMSDDDWNHSFAKALGVFLNGEEIPDPDPRGQRVADDSFLVLFNAHDEQLEFVLPSGRWGELWSVELDTADGATGSRLTYQAGATVPVAGHSLVLLKRI